jgi:type IV pilus biogenesis protein PilP
MLTAGKSAALLGMTLLLLTDPVTAQVTDPVTEGSVDLIEQSGVLARQSRLGEGVLILERQLQHARAIESLIGVLGPDALIEVAPGEQVSFSDTPAGLRARIEVEKLKRELELISAAPDGPAQAQAPRPDGTEQVNRSAERSAREEPEPRTSPDPEAQITLREIFGVAGDLTAVLGYGQGRIRVREGEALPGGVRVISIDMGGVLLSRRGQETYLRMSN